jgi:hypothetical protein
MSPCAQSRDDTPLALGGSSPSGLQPLGMTACSDVTEYQGSSGGDDREAEEAVFASVRREGFRARESCLLTFYRRDISAASFIAQQLMDTGMASTVIGRQAVVIGGLAAAGALTGYFEHVIVLERDALPSDAVPGPGGPRKAGIFI